MGGGERADLREVQPGGSPVDAPFRVRDVGSDPLHGEDPEGGSPLGGVTAHGTTPLAPSQW